MRSGSEVSDEKAWPAVDIPVHPKAGCTFEEDSDPSLCEYRQGQEDDFDWQLVQTSSWPSVPSDLTRDLSLDLRSHDGPSSEGSYRSASLTRAVFRLWLVCYVAVTFPGQGCGLFLL
ncbi:hypothetical protein NFI96_007762 [Prochilodus magdalenae]|nr:hypothetical protein NFI96_007762 [Prochilodus magdalenae]